MPRVDNPASPIVAKLEGVHLFHFDAAPCAQRVRFALAEKGLMRGREVRFNAVDPAACRGETGRWVSRIVSLIKKDNLTPDYAAIQPNLVVPALVHDGVLYTESMDIIAYIDQAFGGEPLVPHDDPARAKDAEALTERGKSLHQSIRYVNFRWGLGALGKLTQKQEDRLRSLLHAAPDAENLVQFYERFDRDTIEAATYQQHLNALAQAFGELEARLNDGRPFLTGTTLTIADVIWAMKVLRLDECGYPFRSRFPALFAWYQRILKRPAFQSGVMGKHRGLNLAFRAKSRLERLLGLGLAKAA